MSVPIAQVPKKVRRMAMRHLDSVSGSDAATRDAELGPNAWPLYRPDIDDVAYWQFELVDARGNDDVPFGFVVVSTGEHDYPIPHWSFERPPVSVELEADARKRGKKLARIYRLDALAYLAEDDAGVEVARSGQVPAIVQATDGAPPSSPSTVTVRPKGSADDRKPDQVEFVTERIGAEKGALTLADPTEWPRLKKQYGAAFAHQLADVRKGAGRAWKVDRDVEEFGEGVMAGEPFSVRLLKQDARVVTKGEAKDDVTLERDDKRRGPPKLHGRTKARPHDKETDFELQITYADGDSEVLRYFVVSPDTGSKARPKNEGKPR